MTMLRIASGLLLAGICASATAADVSPESEYQKRLRLAQSIQPLGDTPFGESLNLFTGEVGFNVADIVIEGTGPSINLSRTLLKRDRTKGFDPAMLGNWDLSIPRIETLIPAANRIASSDPGAPGALWTVGKDKSLQRCSKFDIVGSDVWWSGYELVDGSGGRQPILARDPQNQLKPAMLDSQGAPMSFPALTTKNWQIGCLPTTSNGQDGEGFLAVSPDGTKYYLDHLVGVRADTVTEILPSPEGLIAGDMQSSEALVAGEVQPMVGPVRLWYPRQLAMMYVSKIEDRFGNTLVFSYVGRQLQSITGSDGRVVTFTWRSDAPLIEKITVQPGAEQRIWQYEYSGVSNVADSGWEATLTGVVLPDASRWTYNGVPSDASLPNPNACTDRTGFAEGASSAFTVTTPSGLVGQFVTRLKWHGRSYVPSGCDMGGWGGFGGNKEAIPLLIVTQTLISKTFSGPGIPTRTQSYVYSAPAASAARDTCAITNSCADSRWVETVEANGEKTRQSVSTRWGVMEGKVLKTETFSAQGELLASDSTSYASNSQGAFPARFGSLIGASYGTNLDASETIAPIAQSIKVRQGVTFTWSVPAVPGFDKFARPLAVQKSSSLGARSESTTYYDDEPHWVLGQVATQKIGETLVAETSYTALAQPQQVKSFGAVRQSFTYHPDGNLATVKDGNNNVTTVSSWKRGIPQRIDFADTRYLTAGVGDNGWLQWVEDEQRSRTCYTFDAMGRLASITYTSESATNTCNTSTWAQTIQSFAPSAIGRYGLPAGYWLQIVDTGKGRTVRHFDALWRPVLEEQFDNTDATTAAATKSMVVKRYDAAGRLAFQSYPVASLTTLADASLKGVWSDYDALGRPTSSSQDSELGLLTTLSEYQNGFKVKVTSPKLQSTTTSFLAYDEPSTDWPVLIEHPESAYTHISRDTYGKPTKIRRSNSVSPSGGTLALDRTYTYNAKQELCASVEPETGATLMGYDEAGNLSWSAAGLPAATPCDATGTTAAVVARKAARTYDARNRLSTLSFPDGLGNQVWTYTANGKPAVLTAYNAASNGEPVTSSYTHNRRGLLTLERLVNSMLDWPYEYKYNANGHLASNNWHGIVIAYAPNQLGQPTQAGAYASNAQYYPNGAVKQFTYGNGIVHTMTQNARQLPARSVDGSVLDLAYVYDKHANVASITDATAGARQSRSMSYDNLDRLLTASGVSFGTATYSYDVLDNLKTATITAGNKPRNYAYLYDASQRLSSITNGVGGATVVGLSYDPQGNLDIKNGVDHNFDYGNRLRDVVGKGTYMYDAHGRRVRDTVNGVAAHSQYLMSGQLAFSTDSRTGKVREHIYLGDDPVAIRERDAPTNVYTYRYLHTDGLGSALVETDASQTVLERSEYEPYGLLTNRAEKDDVGYTGHRQDASTGLTYMQQRYYDPQVGRFLSVDPVTPLEQPVGMFNRFVYSLNNPYKFNDPDGRASIPKFLMKKPVMTVKDTLVYADPSVPKSEVDAIVDSMTDVISENYTLGELAEMAIFVFDAKGPNGDVLYKRISPSDYEALEKMFQSLRKHDPGAAERVKKIMENGIKSGRIRIQEKPNPKPNPKPAPAPKPDPKPNPKPPSKTDKPILPA